MRMAKMITEETTLLFVSHSGDTVRRMCNKALWLEKGHVAMSGDSDVVCSAYEKSCQ